MRILNLIQKRILLLLNRMSDDALNPVLRSTAPQTPGSPELVARPANFAGQGWGYQTPREVYSRQHHGLTISQNTQSVV